MELLNGGLYTLRAERTQTDGAHTDRLGVRLPGSLLSLFGYLSLFLEDRPEEFAYGTNFELGSGLFAVGGSVERDEDAFTGGYLKLRSADLELGLGGGRTAQDWIGHGAVYAKGASFSVAMGGVAGPGRALQHLAGTWHPATRGAGPGAMFASERRNGNDWFVEAFFTDRANFNHFASWGRYGLDQWPHEKTFEAVGDLMRYFRPPIMNQERTTGMGIVGGRYQVRGGAGRDHARGTCVPGAYLPQAGMGAGRRGRTFAAATVRAGPRPYQPDGRGLPRYRQRHRYRAGAARAAAPPGVRRG